MLVISMLFFILKSVVQSSHHQLLWLWLPQIQTKEFVTVFNRSKLEFSPMQFKKLQLSIEELAWNTGSCLALTITKPFKKNPANISDSFDCSFVYNPLENI